MLAPYYLIIKHLHMSCAYLSIAFFIVRAYWSLRQRPILKARWVRILPPCIDTVLLVCALLLLSVIGFLPFIYAKIIGLLFYIGFGTFAIKRGKSTPQKSLCFILALLSVGYILGCAYSKSPWSWLFYI